MNIRQFLSVVEIRTKLVSLSTLGLALAWSWTYRGEFDPLMAVLMVFSSLCIDMGTTAFNSFFDFTSGVDSVHSNREQDKVLVHENLAPGWALLTALTLYLLGTLSGGVIVLMTGPWVLLAGVLSLAAGFLYNGGPRPVSSTPFGEILAGGFLGMVLFLITVYTQTRELGPLDVLAGLPSTFFIASILTVNNTCDMIGDKNSGRLTLSILIGNKNSRLMIPALGILAYLSAGALILMTGGGSPWPLIPFGAGVIITLSGTKKMALTGYSHETKGPSMGAISRLFLVFSLCYALGIGLLNMTSRL